MKAAVESLKHSADALVGITLGELAKQLGVVPKMEKGWVGTLLERALHAKSGSRPQPDFPDLGIELKTIPLDEAGNPKESTFVCTINLSDLTGKTWQESLVCRKLSHVLWIPIQHSPGIAFTERKIGWPLFWKPNAIEESMLKTDWRELTDRLQLGEISSVSSHFGEVLQVRPKGANAKSLTKAYDEAGAPCETLPRGFYLRPRFTKAILAREYAKNAANYIRE